MLPLLTIAEASQKVRGRQLSPLDLVEACLQRIDKFEDRVHAWVVVDREGARQAAAALGREQPRGPLHGIPVGIKDIIDVAGLPTRAGSPLREKHVASADAPLVAALRRAGAVVLGKTVTVEFACFDPSATRNPWDPALRHTPGGSSSGSAAALALGMCLGALGTQTGGSLVRPSSYCGVAACKPTFQRLSTEGIVPVSYHLDHPGPMARTAIDLEILLQALLPAASEWGTVPIFAQRKWDCPLADSKDSGHDYPLSCPRLGILEQFLAESAPPVREVVLATVEKLRAAGAVISPVTLSDGFAQVMPMHRRIMSAEAAAYHREPFTAHRAAYGPMISGLLDEGLKLLAVDYAAALAWQRQWRIRVRGLFDGLDALLMPSTDATAPATLETTGPAAFQAPWSCAGVPVVTIPCALADDRMPVGLQVIAPADGEATLLRVAQWCEHKIAFDKRPLLLSNG